MRSFGEYSMHDWPALLASPAECPCSPMLSQSILIPMCFSLQVDFPGAPRVNGALVSAYATKPVVLVGKVASVADGVMTLLASVRGRPVELSNCFHDALQRTMLISIHHAGLECAHLQLHTLFRRIKKKSLCE